MMERRSGWRALALGAAVCVGAMGAVFEAHAEELLPGRHGESGVEAKDETKDEGESAERREQIFRAEMGVGLLGLSGGSTSDGGLGGLGAIRPYLQGNLTVGLRLTPAFWLFGGFRGGAYSGPIGTGLPEGTIWNLGGEVGARLEIPVARLLSVSGYASLDASRSVDFASTTTLGGEIGAGLHIRPTDLFGIRVELGLLRAAHSFTEVTDPETAGALGLTDDQSTSVNFGASPRIAMTFSF
jgi:hypothetical protein